MTDPSDATHDRPAGRSQRGAPKFTDTERRTALHIYETRGATEAARVTGIARQTISSWAKNAGVLAQYTAGQASRIEIQRMRYAERASGLADRGGDIAAKAYELADRLLDEGRANDAKQAVTAAAIAIDKSNLLSGGATERHDVRHLTLSASLETLVALQRRAETTMTIDATSESRRSPDDDGAA